MSKMTEEELQTKVFYSLGQAEVSSSERVLKIGDELMQAIHSYTQEKCREARLDELEAVFAHWAKPGVGDITFGQYKHDRIAELQAQLNKSKGE